MNDLPETEEDIARANAAASRERRGTVIAALRAVIVIAVGLFVWRMINRLN